MIITFTGCAKVSEEIKPKSVFESAFTLDYNSMQIKGKIIAEQSGIINLSVEKPESLNGLSVKLKDNQAEVSYKGIKTELNNKQFPKTAFFNMINTAIKRLNTSDTMKFTKTDNGYSAEDKTDLGDMKILLDNNFSIKSLSIADCGFNIKFE